MSVILQKKAWQGNSAEFNSQVQVLARLGVVDLLLLVRRKARKETLRPPGQRGIPLLGCLMKPLAMSLRLAGLESLEECLTSCWSLRWHAKSDSTPLSCCRGCLVGCNRLRPRNFAQEN